MRNRTHSNSRSGTTSQGAKPPVRRQFFRRQKSCPFSGENAVAIDYKNTRMLQRFISEKGKITPARISSVSTKKQRELAIAIKRARFLGLLPFATGAQ